MNSTTRCFAIALLLVTGRAWGQCTEITALPYTISAPGNYCLTQDLSTGITSGNAVTINATNVVLDLGGHAIDGYTSFATQANGIYAGMQRGVVVRNGSVRGFFRGVWLEANAAYVGNVVENMRVIESRYMGIRVNGGNTTVRNNQVFQTGGTTVYGSSSPGFAISVFGEDNFVYGNEVGTVTSVGGASTYGIFVNPSHWTLIEGNRLVGTGTGFYGIYVANSTAVNVVNNRITNALRGVYYTASTGRYRDNLTYYVTTPYTGGTDAGNNQ